MPAATDGQARLAVAGVAKRFGAVQALADCSFAVAPGEILSLLGPSGCGKSTLLNAVAGFVAPDAGTVRLDGRDITGLPPNRRDVAMVFQSYALFPHMTVRRNILYGPTVRRMPRARAAARLDELIALFALQGLEERLPAALSGGQRQRVALARALAVEPPALLMDEALSALDKQLRDRMQIDLAVLLRRLGITTIMVTHDQREAFTMADRVAVMEGGRIVQIGRPREIYGQPASAFVLGFIGDVNRLRGAVRGGRFETPFGLSVPAGGPGDRVEGDRGDATRWLRVEDVRFATAPTAAHPGPPLTVAHVGFLGATVRVVATAGAIEIVGDHPAGGAPEPSPGDPVWLEVTPDRLCALPGATA